ncbi:MAG: hypothetical protein JST59_13130 [Actinobacteria bacterium]|nr:hypothetical protein [Actinomycetota bacterium]
MQERSASWWQKLFGLEPKPRSTPPDGDEPHGYECSAELVLDPKNPHDKFAVRVEVNGRLVGHLGVVLRLPHNGEILQGYS